MKLDHNTSPLQKKKNCTLFCFIWKLWLSEDLFLKVEIVLIRVKFFKIIQVLILNVGKVPDISKSYKKDGLNMEIAT